MQERYLTVTALTKYIKKKIDIDPHLRNVWLAGEISNFNSHSSGHMYLTIKDKQTRISAVMFAGNNRNLKFRPENGMQVLIKGNISVFEPYGNYQLYITHMEPDGVGALYLAYDQLKNKLAQEGLFDDVYKRTIPSHPTEIGVITSPTGAAVKDIITTIKRRYPIVNITVIPVIVQGKEAVASIVDGIRRANASTIKQFDTLIVGRGGGSIEDLWGFNEEAVVRAIFDSQIPIISAVGHETDMTLSDFAADLRAATPTGAAEIAVPALFEMKRLVEDINSQIRKLMEINYQRQHAKLEQLKSSYAFHMPQQALQKNEEYLDRIKEQMKGHMVQLGEDKTNQFLNASKRLIVQHPVDALKVAEQKVTQTSKQLNRYTKQQIQQKTFNLYAILEKLTLLDPIHTIKRGFSIPYDTENHILKSVKDVNQQDEIKIRLMDGYIYSIVTKVEEEKHD